MNANAEHTAKPPALVAGAQVAAIVPTGLDDVYRIGQAVARSGLAPYGMDTPEKITIAVMTGLELGLPPMQAIQSIAVINGRPCIWGDALMAIISPKPDCLWIMEEIEGEGDAMLARCTTQRVGMPGPVSRTFSVDDAKRASLWQTEAKVTKRGKDGSSYQKDNDSPWYRYPKRMLQMRARSWCLRDVYAHHLKGIQEREEVDDFPMRDVTPPPAPTAAMDSLKSRMAARTDPPAPVRIIEHVESEIAPAAPDGEREPEEEAGNVDGAGLPSDEPEDAGEVERITEEEAQRMRDWHNALTRANSARALKAQADHFWAPEAPPDEGDIWSLPGRIYYLHRHRMEKGKDLRETTTRVMDLISQGLGL